MAYEARAFLTLAVTIGWHYGFHNLPCWLSTLGVSYGTSWPQTLRSIIRVVPDPSVVRCTSGDCP